MVIDVISSRFDGSSKGSVTVNLGDLHFLTIDEVTVDWMTVD